MAATLPKLGETFTLPLSKLVVPERDDDPRRNYRGADARQDAEGLRELAESIAANGQLHPLLVAYVDGAWHVVAGYRRAWAMRDHAAAFKFKSATVKRVDAERADVLRLVENFNRENPTTAETCRYLYELSAGKRGPKRSVAELSDATGLSTAHVKNLIRFWRVLPDVARQAWAADQDGRFTFRVLHGLAKQVQKEQSTDEDIAGAIDVLLGRASMSSGASGASSSRAASGRGSAGGSSSADDGSAPKRKPTLTFSAKLRARLESARELVDADDRARTAMLFLDVLAGEADRDVLVKLVDDLLEDLGAKPSAA